MDTYETDPIGAAPAVARLLLELRGRANVDVKPVGRSLQVRPKGGKRLAVNIHPGGVDVAVDPESATAFLAEVEGSYLKDPEDPAGLVSLDADWIDINYDALLDAAVKAVEVQAAPKVAAAPRARATATGTGTTTTRKAAAPAKVKPAPRPEPKICSSCRQYELLASGECPSGYC
ncbi:hypothetical protein [Actinoplanes derwentensis]|uniref:Uncharacterized protein n=1 Tax=Actinoplanes derwentensis TaxID=113562 RepID=A0A1H1TT70_9ACTN|nr:hypothetical protein [Actinoplanes derwentensis]GID85127.1 hypothetical protein Ade03nite_40510 [Actinoplanes derwentensis]SDS63420.1 hypothetical protein SAMN04489716_1234 [Actinoplanes derwentensis]